jgi:hypothetical protein
MAVEADWRRVRDVPLTLLNDVSKAGFWCFMAPPDDDGVVAGSRFCRTSAPAAGGAEA